MNFGSKKSSVLVLVVAVIALFIFQMFVGSFGLVNSSAASQSTANESQITLVSYNGQDSSGLADLQAGKIAAYDFELTPTETSQLNSSISTMSVPADVYDLLLNPQNTTWGFNPFQFAPVRQAMNYIVDRSYFINTILGGAGISGITPYAGEPDELVVSNVTAEYQYYNNYSIPQANATIYPVLTANGAVMSHGQWSYHGTPITIYLFDRTDDPVRAAYTGFLQTQLQNLGFTVTLIQGGLSKEVSLVYSSDPANTTWSILPEGWGGAYSYYDESLLADFTGTVGAYPPMSDGYGLSMSTYNDSSREQQSLITDSNAADQIDLKLFSGSFSTLAQRAELLQNLTNLSFALSTRIWLGTSLNVYASNPSLAANFSPSFSYSPVLNLISDVTMTSPSGSATIGVRYLSQGSFNPVAGFTDQYTQDLVSGVVMPVALNQGSTGYPYLLGISDKVVEWNSTASTPVPSSAYNYNATTGQFVSVPAGTEANTVVIANFNPLISNDKWVDGTPITLADFLYEYIIAENATLNPKSPIYDSAASVYSPSLSLILGFKILNTTAIEIYSPYYYPDEVYAGDTVATAMFPLGYAAPAPGSFPWQLYQAMAEVVGSGKAAWSSTASAASGAPWLSLVSATDVSHINTALSNYASSSYIPAQLAQLESLSGVSLVTASSAQSGYSAASSFIGKYGNALISDGPYYVSQYQTSTTPNFAILTKSPYFVASGVIPPQLTAAPSAITTQATNIPTITSAGSTITVTAISTPIGSKTGSDATGATVVFQILSSKSVVYQATATAGSNGQASFTIPSTISPGTYTIEVFSSSSSATLLQPLSQTITITSGTVSQVTSHSASTTSSTTTSSNTTVEIVAGLVAVVVVIVVAVVFFMRRPSQAASAPQSSPSSTT